MLNLTVDPHGAGDYCTIGEALEAIPYGCEATIVVGEGTYNERLFSDKRSLAIRGEGEVVITASSGGRDVIDAKRKRGTFRSATAFFSGEELVLENLTIINGADPSQGQAIALYLDVARCHCRSVRLKSHQDTLFVGPLPQEEREEGGFYGPRHLSERRGCELHFHQGLIEGSVDFIFGSGDARFVESEICSVGAGWVCAPSTVEGGQGFVFDRCRFTHAEGVGHHSVHLMRPWRPGAKTTLESCLFADHIAPALYDDWPGRPGGDGTLTCLRCTFIG